ncbi:uncharacterized protein mslnb isoform X9 [Poecilia latipinna]|uniref:uncharacterized protein mslnb isoform X9 n=1 Tax=Poecilia latipinna TaxID=48699 RepID=UPI00072E86FA|nr:PREDICTED: uncharacterized protein LOC106959223 isoform X9 [Poecilia latipinna]
MKSRYLFLLVYLVGATTGNSRAQRNTTCGTESCGQELDTTSRFLQCVGLPSTDTGKDHMQRLKVMLEATMDVYTFMKSSMTGVPVLSLEGALNFNPGADPLQNEALVQMWLEVKIKPLLGSITKHFLSCLSTKNFSCSTYQTVVRELSQYFSEMNPVRQKWIYTFFMYPFLSGERVAGCVNGNESSEEWLMKNFGAFRAMARMKDFTSLNMVFSGLEVLHLLSPAQKAELLLKPEVAGLDNGTLTLVFNSLLSGQQTTPSPANSSVVPFGHSSPHSTLKEITNGFMTAFRPIGSFAHEFVSFTRQRDVSEIKSTTLAQFLLNWTLAELADVYEPPMVPDIPQFDVTNVGDWYQQVVLPLLRRILPNDGDLMHQNITLAFHELYFLEHGGESEYDELQDVCSVTLDKSPCGLTDVVESIAHIMHCAAKSELTMTEATIMRLITELAERLNSLIKEFATTNFAELASDIKEIFNENEPPTLTQHHLNDPEFIKLWYQIKLLPLLPDVNPDLLSCLSTKNFSCPVYQTLVAALGESMRQMDADMMYSHNIYRYFIYSFLNHTTTGPQCISSANQSAEWVKLNFGFFSSFASVIDFYQLNPDFSALEALPVLTPKQLAEMLLLPLPGPTEKDTIIHAVFDFLLESPEDRKFTEVLHFVVQLAEEVNPPCNVYKLIFERMYGAITMMPPDLEPVIWARIDDLMGIAPAECVPAEVTCQDTQINSTLICRSINSSVLQSYLNNHTHVSCSFTLEEYACAQLEDFTAEQLASLMRCNLPSNSSHSRVLWKLLLTKLSSVLNPALDMLANTSVGMIPSAEAILDVIEEIRLSALTDGELTNSSVIHLWFAERLSGFLPFASGRFLLCLTSKNLSCPSYQQILQVFVGHFEKMPFQQQLVVLKDFILRFLLNAHSDQGCLSSFNNSAQWLTDNFGPFSEFVLISELIHLNRLFKPLEALQLLTPHQTAQLLGLPLLNNTDAVIDMLFDYMTKAPVERRFTEFLSSLVMFSETLNLSCSSYKTLFTRLDDAMATATSDIASAITYTKVALFKQLPLDCSIYSGQCNATMTNETEICMGVNSTELQIHLDRSTMVGRHCSFSVEEFACASLSGLTAVDLAAMLGCDRVSDSRGSKPAWKLLLSKASLVLDQALDLLSNTTLRPDHPSASMILDSIRELRLDVVNMTVFNDPAFVQMWFGRRLRPFLPAVSEDFLSCLSSKSLDCSTYQYIVKTLSKLHPVMLREKQMSVFTHFITVYLTTNNTADPSCSSNTVDSSDWLQKNLGGFSVFISIQELLKLYPDFSPMEALASLSVGQLVGLFTIPGLLTTSDQVAMVMKYVPDPMLAVFFDEFSVAIRGNEQMMPSAVRSAMLEVVFNRANLSHPSVEDSVVSQWLNNRLPPLVISLIPSQVNPYFQILAGRNCSIGQQGVTLLNSTILTLTPDSQKEIYNHIILALKAPPALRCYGDGSFYSFVEDSFLGFQFPNLTTFLSLMPRDQKHLLVNSMPPSHLGNLLRRPDVVDDEALLCGLYSSYVQTRVFLETESLPVDVRRPTLPCVWPMALSSTSRSEVNAWFDRSLQNYLVFLSKSLISPDVTHNTSCLAFQKLVSVLGQYNYTAVDFVREDVFSTIRNYLQSATPRCYDPNHPELNSTAWFAEYIGPFMPFLTLEILQTFGSDQTLQVFTVNPLNIALLNHSVLPQNLTDYYTKLVYQQDSNFHPLLLPMLCRCVAPAMAFTQLTPGESLFVLQNLTIVCQDLDPQISAALTSNLGDDIDSNAISALGNESTSMSKGQIKAIQPQQLVNALFTLSNVMGWNGGQAKSIIESLLTVMQINSSSSLFTLGTLIIGVPSRVFRKIQSSEILVASRNPSLVGHMMSAPKIVQQIFVTQILSVNSTGEAIIQNVPDEMATEIPRVFLQSFTAGSVTKLNKKKWKRQQAELFFGVIAMESSTAVLGSANNLSSSVLQGFTCTSVRTIQKAQVKNLVKACRRKGTDKVKLVESQLTCMFNLIRKESDITSFELFPPDVLLYYDYSLVSQSNCRQYFEQLSDADFSVFSSELSYKRTALFDNARSCLGITTTNLTKDQVTVLGNMCCYLSPSYILDSDESILEKLKTCPDLSAAQAAAVETRLIGGTTRYRLAPTWTETTLRNLDTFPLYMSSGFYDNFDQTTKRSFLKYYLKVLKTDGVSRAKIGAMKANIRRSIRSRLKRQAVTECTVGNITQVTISGVTFPFDYSDINQFNSCLSAAVVRDNLEIITQKVDQEDYLKIVLTKLQEAYSTTVPEDQVQILGPASRIASIDQINTWNITEVDTLASLMDTTYGAWDPSLAKAIISKYLSVGGNKLESAELNAIGGPNLCSVDAAVLSNISQLSLKDADALDVSNCTRDKLKVLFSIALQAFQPTSRSNVPLYQLIQPYLGGAPYNFVQSLVASDVNMDLQTFINLDESVIQSLRVSEVKGLLGNNLADLRSFENTPVVRSWISTRLQSELDTLDIGLTGGRASSSASPNSTSKVTTPAANPTTTPSTTVKTTKGAGAQIHGDVAGLTFFVFLALLVSSNQIGM